jgi:hypothetical protein
MDLGAWLRGLGLGRYEAAFRENEIDERVLRCLTQEDLKEIGVGAVGHRRILLDAIAALRPDAGAKAAATNAVARFTTPSASAEDRAERRQVKVMFVDLVGSTALSARAQQSTMPVVGFLNSASADGYASMAAAFRRGQTSRSSRPIAAIRS